MQFLIVGSLKFVNILIGQLKKKGLGEPINSPISSKIEREKKKKKKTKEANKQGLNSFSLSLNTI